VLAEGITLNLPIALKNALEIQDEDSLFFWDLVKADIEMVAL
jgi:hypothetical protein